MDKVVAVSTADAATANARYPLALKASSSERKHRMHTAIKANDDDTQRMRRRESRSTSSR